MTRFIALLGILFLILVAVDPDRYAIFGLTVGFFLVFSALFVGKLHKNAGGAVFALGVICFGVATVGAEYYQEIRIVAALAVFVCILWLLANWRMRHLRQARQRTPAERRQFQEQPPAP